MENEILLYGYDMGSFLGIMLISAATLLLELALLRLFAVQQFYHFAFMAVSLALLGAGASGSILSIWRRRPSPAILSAAFSFSALGAYLIINNTPFDSFSIAWDGKQVIYLAAYFLAAAIPFLFSGLLVGTALIEEGQIGGRGSHKVYSANLIGSSCGSLGSLWVLFWFGGPGAVIFSAITGLVAALLFVLDQRLHLKSRKFFLQLSFYLALAVMAVLLLIYKPPLLEQNLSPYKTLSILEQAIDTEHILTRSSATARLDLLESPVIHVMPGLSLFSPAGIPPQAGLLVDGDELLPITRVDPHSEEAQTLLSYLPQALPHILRPHARTLVLDAGSGLDVMLALAGNAAEVIAVEENEQIVEIIGQNFGPESGDVFAGDNVMAVIQSDRVFAGRSQLGEFNLVIVTLTGQHRPIQSGAYTLTEDYGTTVEAYEDYLSLLADDGLLVVTRWLQTPPSESARAFATMAEALNKSGRDPKDHLIAFRTLRTMTILASSHPLASDDLQSTRAFLNERGFDLVFMPGIREEETNRFNVLPEAHYYELFREILNQPEAIFQAYRYEIRPPTDNHPFFFHFFKWRQTPEIIAGLGQSWQPFGGSGFFVLVAMLLLVSLAAGIFVIGPLLVFRRRGLTSQANIEHWRGRVFVYFAALGLAFLFVEIPLAQQFILLLGKPVIALAVVIFAVLLFSGLGSLMSRRMSLPVSLAILVVLAAVYPLIIQWLAPFILPWPQWLRIVMAITILAPLGFFMGFPFASGLRLVEKFGSDLVPWAWAINGSFSVISSVLAVMLALTWGFALVLWLGAAAYGLAFLVFRKVNRLSLV